MPDFSAVVTTMLTRFTDRSATMIQRAREGDSEFTLDAINDLIAILRECQTQVSAADIAAGNKSVFGLVHGIRPGRASGA